MDIHFPLSYILGNGIAGSQLSICFPQHLYSCTFPLVSPSFSESSPTLVIFYFLDYSHLIGCEVLSHCGFYCISLMTKDVKHLFRGILAICVSFLKKCLFTSLGARLLQSSLTLWELTHYSLPGSSVHGILQARILEWVAISFSSWSFQFTSLAHI